MHKQDYSYLVIIWPHKHQTYSYRPKGAGVSEALASEFLSSKEPKEEENI